ncbi:STAS domain-containing protein [Thermaerobacillus caldiproteolyticus]|uniref:Anti-sigma factor antagonist n=1 Tax=Thermaerobacillus caldiproteolyticus TaxID=247480 RepID=A0A7V9Z788_9BACL|nr:STAS domain-containing protein [Anoxybacillus caldiproteolyticus]MBA2875235.1 anti-anti-sigma factor [Anoxybacillus caldiproteolyticus]QPA32824.1 STAS domain-containing protein [Anoxybacillus caldiproteolyticus]
MFSYELVQDGQSVTIYFKGDLDIEVTEIMEEIIQELQFFETIHINLSEVLFVDSTGIGLLINLVNTLKQENKHVMISGTQPEVEEVFKIIQLKEILGEEIFVK